MKKSLLILMAVPVLFAACSKDDTPDEKFNFEVKEAQLVTMVDGVTVGQMVTYGTTINATQATMNVAARGQNIGNTSNVSFTTDDARVRQFVTEMTIGSTQVRMNTYACTPTGEVTGGGMLSDFKASITEAFFRPNIASPGIAMTDPKLFMPMRYRLDGMQVTTFMPDGCYYGKTTTTYPGQGGQQSYTNDAAIYRIKFDLDNKKATIAMYDAKFAEQMPNGINIILKDLDVTFSRDKITITGENIIPQMIEGEGLTPNEKYVFNQINITTTDTWLTKVKFDYQVATVFHGEFEGTNLLFNIEDILK